MMKITFWGTVAGLTVLTIATLGLAGCGGSSVDLDEKYGLNDPENKRNPATPIVELANDMQQQLRSGESAPARIASQLAENVASFSADSFGDHAADFEKLTATADKMAEHAKSGASRAEFNELAQAFVDQAKQLEQKMAAEE